MESQNRSVRLGFFVAVVASIAFHMLCLTLALLTPRSEPQTRADVVEVQFNTPEPKTVKKAKLLEQAKQIVEQDEKAANDEVDEKAKFLSRNNQKVVREVIAKNRGEFKNTQGAKPGEKASGKKSELSIKDLMPTKNFSDMARDFKIHEENLEKTAELAAIEKPKAAAKTPSGETPTAKPGQGGSEASQSQDYIKDVDEGMETLLSTREFLYYTFYARVRKQLTQFWLPKVRSRLEKIFHQGRAIASSDDRVTKLMITLDRKGNLINVQVLSNSGLRDLDDAAIEAFREAAPFPNPPEGIVEADGTIKIRWDFVLEA